MPNNAPATNEPRVYVIHENDAWVEPLRQQFEDRQVPYTEWFLDKGIPGSPRATAGGRFLQPHERLIAYARSSLRR